MVRYHAVTRNDCQRRTRFLFELSVPRANRTIVPPQTFALLAGLEQQNNLILIQGPMQATAVDKDVYRVRVYGPQPQYKFRTTNGSTNKHSSCQKQNDEMWNIFNNWIFRISKFNSAMNINKLS